MPRDQVVFSDIGYDDTEEHEQIAAAHTSSGNDYWGFPESTEESGLSDDPESHYHQLARVIVDGFAEPHGDVATSAPVDIEQAMEGLHITLDTLGVDRWVGIFESGFMQRLFDCIFDADFCGSSEQTVHGWKDSSHPPSFGARFSALVLHVLSECCVRLEALLTLPRWREEQSVKRSMGILESAAHAAIENSSRLWQLAFKFRGSLLSQTYEDITYPIGDARNTSTQLASNAEYITRLKRHFNLPLTYSHVDEEATLLLLWLRRAGLESRLGVQALACLAPLLWDKTEKERQRRFCEQIIPESTTLPALNQAFCKHYKIETWHGQDVFAMVWIHALIIGNIQHRDHTIDILDYKTISCVLAACRRQICRGGSREQDIRVISAMHCFMTTPLNQCLRYTPPKFKEWLALALAISLFVGFPDTILNAVIPSEEVSAQYFHDVTHACLLMFDSYKNSPRTRPVSASLNMLRRYTLSCGEEVLEEARTHPIPDNEEWSSILSLLRKLVRMLPQPTHEDKEEVVSLKRCAWEKCCCHVFKPAHRMRVCVGCYAVAYCGERCRERDWVEGSHSTRCRRLKHF